MRGRGKQTIQPKKFATFKKALKLGYKKTGLPFFSKDKLKIIVLGGLEEIGRNMTLMEYGNDIIIIDMGIMFPEESMPGVDYVIPNISYLKGKERNIRGVIITHGHYDHIGAIPHLIGELGNPPIFTGKLTAGIIQKRQEEFRTSPKLNIVLVDETSKIKLGKNFEVELFRVNHTIPDSFGVAVTTPVGLIIHSGDFKFDLNPINDKPADMAKIAGLGQKNVLALMLDSTDAEDPGYQLSEMQVYSELEKIFEKATGRIIIGTFASLISRIQLVLDLAEKFGRKVLIEGRSMKANVEITHQLGYLKIKPGIILENEAALRIPDNKLVIIGTGAQGQQTAFLMRLATDEHRFLSVKKGDLVIFSSSVIPGNERTIQALKDTFYRKGAKVIHYQMMDVHAGGHAKQEDLKLMIRMIKPKYFIPIEAYHYMLRMHADLAESVGIPPQNIFVADNGQVIEFTKKGGVLTNHFIPSEYVFVDGLGVGDVSNIVLRDRQVLAGDGMMVVIATVDAKTGKLLGSPDIISRGFVYLKESKHLIEQTRERVRRALHDTDPHSSPDTLYLKNKLRNEIGQFLYVKTKRRPMVLPVVIAL